MDEDDRLDEILGAWRSRCDAGDPVHPDDVIRANPEHAAALRACFDALCRLPAGPPPPRPAEPRPEVVADLRRIAGDRYSDFRVTGEGGMGIVYRATDTDLARDVAFKVVRPAASAGPGPAPTQPLHLAPPAPDAPESKTFRALRARFLREARITAALEHPGVVPVHEIGETPEGVPYYTMRLVRGNRTLAQAIAESPTAARLALLDVFLKVCDTIRYAHAHGVVHRDLKPANVALGEFGEVFVIDWGLARITARFGAPAVPTSAGTVGTPGYMSPEAALGLGEQVDERSDVYSLGAILFEILTGQLPFPPAPFANLVRDLTTRSPPAASDVAPGVPALLSAIAARALSQRREDRFSTVDELSGAIRAWQVQSERDATIAEARRAAEAGVDVVRDLGTDATEAQFATASHMCRTLVELVPADSRARELESELTRLHEFCVATTVARTVRTERLRRVRRLTVVGLAGAAAIATVVALTLDEERRRTAAERDLKAQALELAQAESASRIEALDRAQRLSLMLEARELVATDPGLALLLAQESWRRHSDPRVAEVIVEALGACHEERTLVASSLPIAGAWYDAAERRVATAGDDGAVRLWDAATGRLERKVDANDGAIRWAAFDAPGRRIVTAPADGRPVVIDVETGHVLATLEGHEGGVGWAEFSPDGRTVATAGWDGTARLWEPGSGRPLARLEGHAKRVRRAVFSPDGGRVATVSEDGDLRVWDAATGASVGRFTDGTGRLFDLAWSPDGRSVATAAEDATARVWDIATGACVRLTGHGALVISVSFSPGGDRVLTASWDGWARVFDPATGALRLRVQGERYGLHGAAWSRDGTRIVTAGSWGHAARCWDASDGHEVATLLGHAGRLSVARFTADGSHVLTSSEDGTARIWRVAAPVPVVRVTTGSESVRTLVTAQISPDGRRFVTAEDDQSVRVWDVENGLVSRVLAGTVGARAVSFDPASRRVVAGGADGTVAVFDVDTGVALSRVQGHAGAVTAAEFTPDGAAVLTAAADGSLRLGDAATGSVVRPMPRWEGRIVSAHVSLDGRRAVVAIHPGSWSVLDLPRGVEVRGAALGDALCGDAAISADGLRVATAELHGETVLWDAESGRRIGSLGDQSGGCAAVFDDAGVRVASALEGGVVRVGSAASGRELLRIPTDTDELTSLRFSRDGRFLVATGTREATRVYDAGTGELLGESSHPEGWVLGASLSADAGRVLTWGTLGVVRVEPLDVAAAAARAVPRELSPADRARFGLAEAAPTSRRLEDVRHALESGRPAAAIALARDAIGHAAPDDEQRALLLYCVACAGLRLDVERGSPGCAVAAIAALESARRAGADPARLIDSGFPDIAAARWLERLSVRDADAVLRAAFGDRPTNATDAPAWAIEARDAARRGHVEAAIGLFRRALAAGGAPRSTLLVELARLRCVRAAARPADLRAADIENAIERLIEAGREAGGLSDETLASPEFEPLRADARFRALAEHR